ncbi:hypothetical protein E2562_026127 [Oryza meyeriana var. granulata]|uniref:Uncharacterized protein n=1 Tax=Oryza meyeriana var. granulata TaxID=110450 RepID=A0A6G1FCT6_9ORYZ|nr:hypothetical protein E2562_026127 [Oryza meyeriana var. granulata]
MWTPSLLDFPARWSSELELSCNVAIAGGEAPRAQDIADAEPGSTCRIRRSGLGSSIRASP